MVPSIAKSVHVDTVALGTHYFLRLPPLASFRLVAASTRSTYDGYDSRDLLAPHRK